MADEVGSLSVVVGLDTVAFNQGIKELSQKMQILGQEFKNSSAGLNKVSDAAEISRLKITMLTGKIGEQRQLVDQLRTAHANAADQYGETSRQAQAYELRLLRAEGTLQSMERELTSTTRQLEIQSSRWTTLGNAMQSASDRMKSIGEGMKKAGQTLTMAVTAPIVAAGVASVKLASDLAENMNKVDVAFKDNAQEVKDWSGTTLKSFGISKGSALEMASLFGDMGTAMGQSTSAAADMSKGLVGLAGDLASFKNIGIAQAQDALKGIFTGEGESLKSLGIIMQDSTLIAYALATGHKTAYSEMSQAEKVALRYAFVMDATKNAQGDFARTSDGTANQMRIFSETMKELGENMGQYILPVITPLIAKLSEMAKAFGNLSPATQKTILVIAGIAAVIGPVLVIVGTLITAVGAIAGALGAASLAIAAAGGVMAFAIGIITNPITLAIAAIALLVFAGYELSKHWEELDAKAWEICVSIGGFFVDLWTGITEGFGKAMDWFKSLPDEAKQWGVDMIQGFVDGITNMISSIGDAIGNVAETITSFLHFSTPDQGPLADYESWMPDFMGGLAAGIEKKKYLVRNAMNGLATDMSIGVKYSSSPGMITGASQASSAGVVNYYTFAPGSVVIPAKDLDEMRTIQDFFGRLPQVARARG